MKGVEIHWIFSLLCKCVSIVHSLPFRWDPAGGILYLKGCDKSQTSQLKRWMIFQLYIHRAAIIILMGQEILQPQSASFTSKILHWLATMCLLSYNIQLHSCIFKSDEVVLYINGLLQFEETLGQVWTDKPRRITEQMNFLFVIVCAIAVFVLPIGYVFGLHWFDPFEKTSLIGFWLLHRDGSLLGHLVKIAVFLFNYWIWTAGVSAAAFCFGAIQALFTISLRDCIRTFLRVESTSDKISFSTRSVLYRELQVLSTLQTHIQAGPLMAILIAAVSMAMSMTLVILIRFPWTSENLAVIVVSGYLLGACAVAIIFVIGGQAGVWSESARFFGNLDKLMVDRLVKRQFTRWELKWQQRFWRSCRNLIKVRFGSNNFVEEQTPLNCLSCAVSLTVQLLLLD